MIAALLITAYGAVLRLDVLNVRYGPIDHPAWARLLTRAATPLAQHLKPAEYVWWPEPNPYVGGDPFGYIRFAREMRSFYQAHVREPVFLAVTRGWLWLLDWQDVGISFASASMSTLAIFATFLLGRAAVSTPIGLLAALCLAIEFDAIGWAPDGWRDDTFTCMLVLTTWAIVRLRQKSTAGRAVAAGVLGALACLTRITSVSWLAPALLMTYVDGERADRRRRGGLVAIAALIGAGLVAPYIVNCWRQLGDPLIAINAHTVYYRAGEGASHDAPMSALSYVRRKIADRPVRQLDTAITGIFVWPMRNKWASYNVWLPYAGRALQWLAIAGLLLFAVKRNGRLLLVVMVTSLVPYAFTWNIAGGSEWRFVMHVYPIYLIASWYAVAWLVRTALAFRARERWRAALQPQPIATAVAVTLAILLCIVAYRYLPYAADAETLRRGEPVTIETGDRDGVFYSRGGFSAPRTDGAVTVRVVVGTRAAIELPLGEPRAYRLAVRLDPVTPASPRELTLLLNGRLLRRFGLTWDAQRVGSYTIDVDADAVRPGRAVLQLVADAAVPARAAGPTYAWLPPDTPVSLRVWYVRIHPL